MPIFRMSRRPMRRQVSPASLGVLVLLLSLVAGSAWAQGIDIPAMLSPDTKGPATVATAQFTHLFKTDVDDGSEYAKDTALLLLSHRTQLSEKTSFSTIGTYTFYRYDFSSNSGNAYQWDGVHRLVIAGMVGHDLNDRWRLIGGAVVRSWGEGGASYGDSITGGLLGGFDYHPNPDFSIGLIIGGFSALEDSFSFLPVPTLNWKFAEGWRLNVGIVNVDDAGVGAEMSWEVSETVLIGAGAAFQNRRYRLRDKTRVIRGGRTDDGGIGQESGLPVFARFEWKPMPRFALDLTTGVVLAGNLRVESSTGGRIADDDYDPSPFVRFKGVIAF